MVVSLVGVQELDRPVGSSPIVFWGVKVRLDLIMGRRMYEIYLFLVREPTTKYMRQY